MTPKFEVGAEVQFNADVISQAPVYADRRYVIVAATGSWGIGQSNEWAGEYLIRAEDGSVAVTRESSLVAAPPIAYH